MKVLFISNFFYRFGPPIALFRLVRELKKEDKINISILSFLDGPLKKWYEQIGISPMIKNLYSINLQNIKELSKIIKEEKADLVLSNTLDALNGCFAAHLCQKPGILYVHEDWPQINFSTLHLFAFKLSDLIIFSSKYQESVYQPILEGVPTQIIKNGIPFDKFNPQAIQETRENIKDLNNIPRDKKIVSIIGTVCDRKRQDLFVFAAHEILKKRNDIIFLIIGWYREEETYYQLLKKYIQTGKLESNILFLGDQEDIEKYYYISDVVVCCSSNDISPAVLLEALAFKKPIIATSINGIPEIVKDGEKGILIESNNQKQLEQAILKVLDHYDFYQRNIEKNYEKFKAKYNIENVFKTFLKSIQETKFRPKKYSLEVSKNEMKFIAKQDTILRFKKITPLVERKPSSAFR